MVEFIKIKKENFLNLFLFCNPFLMFLNQNLTRFDIDKSFILFQLAIIFLLAILIILKILYLITKKFLNYSFYNFFTYLLVINFFLFFHNDLKLLLPNGRLSSEYALIILIFLSFIFLFNLSKKNIINNLLFFFVLINFFYFSINIIFIIQRDSFKESNLVSKIN